MVGIIIFLALLGLIPFFAKILGLVIGGVAKKICIANGWTPFWQREGFQTVFSRLAWWMNLLFRDSLKVIFVMAVALNIGGDTKAGWTGCIIAGVAMIGVLLYWRWVCRKVRIKEQENRNRR